MGTVATTTSEERREVTTAHLPAVIRTSATARNMIAPFLPEGVSLDRVAASLTIALEKDRAAWKNSGPSPLERCSPMSVLMACAKAAQLGLEIGETAHLVPFGAECTMVPDYKGLAQLVLASGVVAQVEARCVYEKELFELSYGTTTRMTHRPIGDPKKRGEMIGAYAIFRLRARNAEPLVHYMDIAEIDAIRQQYSKQWKKGDVPRWYAEKTCVRQGVKLLPKDGRLAKTFAMFEAMDQVEEEGITVPEQLPALSGGESSGAPSASWPLDDAEPATLDAEG